MDKKAFLSEAKSLLAEAFPERLCSIVLYGSEARGTAAADSDIDLLVLLSGPLSPRDDLWTCVRALYPLVLQLERPIHAKPVDVKDFESQTAPLYRDAKRHGIST
jgi:predicted nucleotidyltransferase